MVESKTFTTIKEVEQKSDYIFRPALLIVNFMVSITLILCIIFSTLVAIYFTFTFGLYRLAYIGDSLLQSFFLFGAILIGLSLVKRIFENYYKDKIYKRIARERLIEEIKQEIKGNRNARK